MLLSMIATQPATADPDRAYVPEPGVKGYGIRGVEGATLADMLASCAATHADSTPEEQLHRQRCAQLRRSLRNQPGNKVGGR